MRNYVRVLSLFLLMGTACASRGSYFSLKAKTKSQRRSLEDWKNLEDRPIVSYKGYTITPEGRPISGVVVLKNGITIARSASNGFFVSKVVFQQGGDVLRFEHPNFVTTTVFRFFKLKIWMKERGEKREFDSGREQSIRFGKGGRLTIPKDAFSLSGKPYNGRVEIRVSYIDVTDENELRAAPGKYIAVKGGLKELDSFGMLEITAVAPRINRQLELELRSTRRIEVSFPTIAEITDLVYLYELNTEEGFWVLKGSLNNVKNTLKGEITSVNSAWNAALP